MRAARERREEFRSREARIINISGISKFSRPIIMSFRHEYHMKPYAQA